MRMNHGKSVLLQIAGASALVAALGLVAMGLSQCRGIDDPVLGAHGRSNPGLAVEVNRCNRGCIDQYKQCVAQENSRHREGERQCNLLPDRRQREACLEAEEQLHERNLESCATAMQQCKRDCGYREGSAGGGR